MLREGRSLVRLVHCCVLGPRIAARALEKLIERGKEAWGSLSKRQTAANGMCGRGFAQEITAMQER